MNMHETPAPSGNRQARGAEDAQHKKAQKETTSAFKEMEQTLGYSPSHDEVATLLEKTGDEALADMAAACRAATDDPDAPLRAYGHLLAQRRQAGGAVDQMLEGLRQQFRPGEIVELIAICATGGPLEAINVGLHKPEGKEAARVFLVQHDGIRNLYRGINPRPAGREGVSGRAKDKFIVTRNAVVVDLDYKDAPPDDPKYEKLLGQLKVLNPLAVHSSGNGVHVYFDIEPIDYGNADNAIVPGSDNEKFNAALTEVGSDPVGDLSRIIRLPGSINIPDEKKRKNGRTLALVDSWKPRPDAKTWDADALLGELHALALEGTRGANLRPLAQHGNKSNSASRFRGMQAPNVELLRAIVEALPNPEEVDRFNWIARARWIWVSCHGTDFESEGEEIFIEFSGRWVFGDGDIDAAADAYRSIKDDRPAAQGFEALCRDLRFRNPDAYTCLRGQIVAAMFAHFPLDEQEAAMLALESGALPQWLEDINSQHAFVRIQQSLMVVELASVDSGEGVNLISLNQTSGFPAMIANHPKVKIGIKDVQLFSAWKAHPQRKEFKGLGMWPVDGAPEGHLNIFTGLAVRGTKAGAWPKLEYHLREIVCGGDTAAFEYLLDLLAWKLQEPLRCPGIGVVLQGGQGTGKSIITTMLGSIFGIHAATTSRSQDIVGNFNAMLEGKVFLDLAEAFFAGDPKANNNLKSLITDPKLAIRRMHTNPYQADNRAMIFMTTNEAHAVFKETDDRRYLVLKVSNQKKGDLNYFHELCSAIGFGGAGEPQWEKIRGEDNEANYFVNAMLARDVTGFKPANMPSTEGGAENVTLSLNGPGKFWHAMLLDGDARTLTGAAYSPGLPGQQQATPDWSGCGFELEAGELARTYKNWAEQYNKQSGNRFTPAETFTTNKAFGRAFSLVAGDVFEWKDRRRDGGTGERYRAQVFDTLDECRRKFAEANNQDPSKMRWT